MTGKKHCYQCGEDKPLDAFHKSTKSGIQSACKACKRVMVKTWQARPKDTKVCCRCDKEKLLSNFGKNSRSADGLSYHCKGCKKQKDAEWFRETYPDNKESFGTWQRNNPEAASRAHKNWSLQKSYGITIEEFEQMLAAQNNLCAVCRQPETAVHNLTLKVKRLSVDHCHETGKVRALLCSNCNTAAGLLQHDPEVSNLLTNYLKLHKTHI